MRPSRFRTVARLVAAAAGLGAGAYAAYVAATWARYGRPSTPDDPDGRDDLLDRFMPRCDVVERHRIRVLAPAAITLAAAREMDINRTPVVRAVFKAREVIMGSVGRAPRSAGLVADMQALGWGILADVPDREIVMGGVTKPWLADPTFHALAPEAFATFDDPDFVKIAWTLRADPDGPAASIFRTETRAIATDARARGKFRPYWSLLSPGIIMIRWAMLRPLKAEAERRAREHTGTILTG